MPSARRKTPPPTTINTRGGGSISFYPSVKPDTIRGGTGRLNLGVFSKLTGVLNGRVVGMGGSEYATFTGLIYDGMGRREALAIAAPDLSDEDVDFVVNGVTPEERAKA